MSTVLDSTILIRTYLISSFRYEPIANNPDNSEKINRKDKVQHGSSRTNSFFVILPTNNRNTIEKSNKVLYLKQQNHYRSSLARAIVVVVWVITERLFIAKQESSSTNGCPLSHKRLSWSGVPSCLG